MVQREVGERLAAGPGTSAYGVPSVLAQLACEVRVLRAVARTVFRPVPRTSTRCWSGSRRTGPGRRRGCARSSTTPSPTGARRWPARSRSRPARHAPRSARAPATLWSRSATRPTSAPSACRPRSFATLAARLGAVKLTALAPGKVNLCLFLGPIRAGRPPRAGDAVRVGLAGGRARADRCRDRAAADEVVCAGVEGPNLVARGARAGCAPAGGTRRRCGSRSTSGSRSRPGMGGGSADAAAALRLAVELAPGSARGGRRARGAARQRRPEPARARPRRWAPAPGSSSSRSSRWPRTLRDRAAAVRALDGRGLPRGRPARAARARRDELRDRYEPAGRGARSPAAACPSELIVNDLELAADLAVPADRGRARTPRGRRAPTTRSCAARARPWPGYSGARTPRERAAAAAVRTARTGSPARSLPLRSAPSSDCRDLRRGPSVTPGREAQLRSSMSNQTITYLVGACPACSGSPLSARSWSRRRSRRIAARFSASRS